MPETEPVGDYLQSPAPRSTDDDDCIANNKVFYCSKTEGMWIGSNRHYKEKPFGIKWTDEPIKALGAYFTYDQNFFFNFFFLLFLF